MLVTDTVTFISSFDLLIKFEYQTDRCGWRAPCAQKLTTKISAD